MLPIRSESGIRRAAGLRVAVWPRFSGNLDSVLFPAVAGSQHQSVCANHVITQDVNVSGPSNAPDAGKALVSGRVQVDRIGGRDRCRRGRKGPESRALPASRDVRLTV